MYVVVEEGRDGPWYIRREGTPDEEFSVWSVAIDLVNASVFPERADAESAMECFCRIAGNSQRIRIMELSDAQLAEVLARELEGE